MPKKHLGQHFLSDPHILRKIVDFSRVGSQDTVVEIGPGKGTLTRALAERVRRVVTIEVDPDLVPSLRTRVPSNVRIIEGDALEMDFTGLADSPYHVVANLPYNVATPLIERLTAARGSIASVTIMLQKEVADRILADPGSRQYGVLSVGIQYFAETEGGFRVPPGAFTPRPKVWSRMIRMTWRPDIVNSPDFMRFVKRAFSSRRKKLVNNLVPSFPGHGRDRLLEIFEREGVSPDARAEDLSVDAFVRLHHALVYNLGPMTDTLEVVPLGGLGEFGMHMMAFSSDDSIFVVDCGILFPEQELLGVDIVVPDITYLLDNREKVRAIVLTHGHEDHIGALPFILPYINVPVYGSPFTLALVRRKLEDHDLLTESTLIEIHPEDAIQLGPFGVEFIAVTHSIVDSLALAIRTPAGLIIHTGDFKIDHSPIDGHHFDLPAFAAYGREGVLALFSDSTNAEREGYTPSERAVEGRFESIFGEAEGRIVVSCFTSAIHRIQIIADAAHRHGRHLAFLGRRMLTNSDMAQQLGALDLPPGLVIRPKEIKNHPRDKVCVVVSGCQGEPMSAMARVAVDKHKDLHLDAGDTVVLSSRMIPGNERAISRMMDHLYRRQAEVIYQDGSTPPVHVSGHASAEELKLMMMLVKPRFFVPIHGDYRHLHRHAAIAEQTGMVEREVLIAETGDVIRLDAESVSIVGKAPVGRVLIDQGSLEEVADLVVRDRRHISEDGIVLPVIVINKQTGELETPPEVVFRGMTVTDDDELVEECRDLVIETIEDSSLEERGDWAVIKEKIRRALKRYISKRISKRPFILPIIMEI